MLKLCIFIHFSEEVEERFGGKLQKTMSGSMYEVVSRVFKHLVQRKITVPGSYRG